MCFFFVWQIKKLGFSVTMRSEDFKVSNVVASVDVQFAIKLEGLAYEHGSSANYEPGKMGQKGGV